MSTASVKSLRKKTAQNVRLCHPADLLIPRGLAFDFDKRNRSSGKQPVPSGVYGLTPLVPAELRASRNELFGLRFVGSFLLRFADRQFVASLFQLPPRITRCRPIWVVHLT
jgi:hypothetical protein